jgi:hypothetical protein
MLPRLAVTVTDPASRLCIVSSLEQMRRPFANDEQMMGVTTGQLFDRPVRVFDLEQPRYQGMPIHDSHQPGYVYALHRRHADGLVAQPSNPRAGASGVIVCMEHSGTHIDALCHQSEH